MCDCDLSPRAWGIKGEFRQCEELLRAPVTGKRSQAPTLKKHAYLTCEKPASPLKSDTLVC